MQIDTREIREGGHVGEIVYICHYNRPDLEKKPLRCVPPTRVIVKSNECLPKNTRVYYSKNHFSPIDVNGKISSKVISPVDNTGFRMRSGNPLFVFDNEAECISEWNNQITRHEIMLDLLIENSAKRWIEEKKEVSMKKIQE